MNLDPVIWVLLQTVSLVIIIAAWVTLPLMIIPGATIIWVVNLVYLIITGFSPVAIAIFVFQTLMMAITGLVDNLLMGGSAKVQGASWWSILAAILGAAIGSFFLPPVGSIIGALLFLFLSEFLQKKNLQASWRSTWGMMEGFGWASVTRLVGGGMMVFWFSALLFLQHRGWA